MSEAAVISLFLTLRVLLLGAILLALPRISRRGLLFGVFVGESFATGEEGGRIRRAWDLGCVAVMAGSLAVGYAISVAGRPVAGNLTGTAVMVLGAGALYLRTYSRCRAAAPAGERARKAVAPLTVESPKGRRLAWFALAISVAAGIVTAAHAILGYTAMPDRVPALSGMFGGGSEMADRSIARVLLVPSLGLVLPPVFALTALLIGQAKLSVREGAVPGSLAAQEAFRTANIRLFAGAAIVLGALTSVLSVQLVRFQLSRIAEIGAGVLWLSGAVVVLALIGLVRIMRGHGQGGSRHEIEAASAPGELAGSLADNTRWKLGIFYVDRDDPSIFIEKRFGIGYTMNYGNRTAVLMVITLTVLLLGLVALTAAAFTA